MLEKTYQPTKIEATIYPIWENSGAFQPAFAGKKQPYVIMMPPPNVTGSLHIGHALNHTLQDILVRYHRMRGYDVLWQPGTDHAGISTQMVVERQLKSEDLSRQELGREKFLERVWDWKKEYGSRIVHQLRRLGISPDWLRERFTLDSGLCLAVRYVFVQLYRQGLIYRDKRLVNWDPKFLTAISDIEVENVETKGTMWRFKYPIIGSEGHIEIATTRPETMFGDTAVAVHPEDERYQHLIGKSVRLPLVNREIPIIADEICDPEKGTGAVKITPAHDFNDFEVGLRHNLPAINIMQEDGCLNENVPEAFYGLDRLKARKKVLEQLQAQELLAGEDETVIMVPHGDRSNAVIEPRLTDQWFVDAKTLAEPAIEAVQQGKTRFVPENWSKTYFEWMNNIQPWCISRQLWWGHRIPAWYGPDGKIFVAMDEAEAQEIASKHYGKQVLLTQDEDVLDTWFSSSLWPFSTLGWPEKTPALKQGYPGDVLVTGHDIIFFWVARMMMMGLHFMKDVPFHTVCITALVRDDKGQKMSKSKGNVIDPLESIEAYGADAVRFSLAALAGPGRNVNFSKTQVEGYRNFATKIWNAFRYCQQNQCQWEEGFNPAGNQVLLNRWIVGEVAQLEHNLEAAFKTYRFDEASFLLYRFIWGRFCDWYLEFTKPILSGDDDAIAETRATTAWVFGQILHLLHPFMPFVTEELWHQLTGAQRGELMVSSWPQYAKTTESESEEGAEIAWVIDLITQIRATRSEMNVPAGAKLSLYWLEGRAERQQILERYEQGIMRMARLSLVEIQEGQKPGGAGIQVVLSEATLFLSLEGIMDIGQERQRLKKEMQDITQEISALDRKLSNQDFVARAPQEVVAKNELRLQQARAKQEKMQAALERLQSLN
ncbi:MAG: valine--tRNA ligase [Pseudomonadota bacterium]